jgi:hypothetical protein
MITTSGGNENSLACWLKNNSAEEVKIIGRT